MKNLPTLTHLQFLVIGLLLETPSAGRDLRARLQEHGARKSGPAFYQLMARLEDGRLVEGSYEQRSVDGQKVRERHYRATGAGKTAWRASQDFYVNVSGRVSSPVGFSHV